MEAKVTLCLKDAYQNMSTLKDVLKQLFIVAKVELVDDSTNLEEYETAYIHSENVHDVGTILMKMKWKANCVIAAMM